MTYLQAHLMLPPYLPGSKKKKTLANFKTSRSNLHLFEQIEFGGKIPENLYTL